MSAPTLTMPKRPKPAMSPPEPEDGYFLVRLPLKYRRLLSAIRASSKRSITQEVQIGIELRAKAMGVEFIPDYPDTIR